mmetsp:Transcript_67861/g.171116  ORF Transcript_67861/g.171116 Transcript_67861/m.171116 type:complete len:182 (-) Transcript_67861:53-598(-)
MQTYSGSGGLGEKAVTHGDVSTSSSQAPAGSDNLIAAGAETLRRWSAQRQSGDLRTLAGSYGGEGPIPPHDTRYEPAARSPLEVPGQNDMSGGALRSSSHVTSPSAIAGTAPSAIAADMKALRASLREDGEMRLHAGMRNFSAAAGQGRAAAARRGRLAVASSAGRGSAELARWERRRTGQ